jgi:hypothetical protein
MSTSSPPSLGDQIKNTFLSPFSWMYKLGPIIWFLIVPSIIFLIVYLIRRKKAKKIEQERLEKRVEGLE